MASSDNRLYEFKPFCLDAASGTLLKDDVIVHLTPKAFETLLVLVQRRVQVVEKEQLLKEVWGPEHVEESQYLRVFMRQLRTKLEADPANPTALPGIYQVKSGSDQTAMDGSRYSDWQ